jgi:hypothetical protein
MRQKGVGRSEQRFFIGLAEIWVVHGNAAIEISATAAERPSIALRHQCPVSKVPDINPEVQPQMLRLTTPKLKGVWGPVRSG